jgi:DNA adenine methylase
MSSQQAGVASNSYIPPRPIVKWAGGKTQLLNDLLERVPRSYGKYIEPFFGGGALFFSLQPQNGVIADSNPELTNVYQQISTNVDEVIEMLGIYENTSEFYYQTRAIDWATLPKVDAAARTIYLNKTCYNGLYRVNRQGQFNVPFGKYKNPRICDEEALRSAAGLLKNNIIVCGDYLSVLKEYAEAGDFVFLDPPYLPVTAYADFKRYTKEQFYEEDHRELAVEVKRLQEHGCHVVLTNSNHPLVHELYGDYLTEIVSTKRYISCHGSSRTGEDVIVTVPPKKRFALTLLPEALPKQAKQYPPTRFMGSKTKLLPHIWSIASHFEFDTVVDLFSGSGIVGYMFKAQGKTVISNDYMKMSSTFAKAMIENNSVVLPISDAESMVERLVESNSFVANKFKGLYFTDDENKLIDSLRQQIFGIRNQYKQAIAMTALIRACMKKRPRGIFTYTGFKYNDGRQDLKKSLEEQYLDAVKAINAAIFDNTKSNKSRFGDAMTLRIDTPDMVYIDPPYYSPLSDNEYVRRYHFVEGLARNWEGVDIQEHTQTKKFKSYPTPFSTRNGAADAFDKLFKKYSGSVLIVSYSSNSIPAKDEMLAIMARHKAHVDVFPVDYRYSFGNQRLKVDSNRNQVQEYLFVGY